MTFISSEHGRRPLAPEPATNAGRGGAGDEHSLAAALFAAKLPAGGAGAGTAAPAAPPSLFTPPASPRIDPNFTSTIYLQSPTVVSAETIYYTTSLEVMYEKADQTSSGSGLWPGMLPFTNNGILWNRCLDDYVGTIISSQNFDYVTNNGLMVSEAPTGQAMTLEFRSSFQGLTNNGGIYALSTKRGAFALITSGFGPLINEGVIAAHRAPAVPDGPNDIVYGAVTIIRYNGGRIVNGAGGSILAEGPRATVIWAEHGGSRGADGQYQPDIENAGRIEAVATDPHYQSVGVELLRFDFEPMTILNSGTIRADIAISLGEYGPSGALQARQLIDNFAGGIIDGAIIMSRYDEIILNQGLIDGEVAMFEGDDIIVNTARMIGPIDLGDGDDLYLGPGASAAATVNGGTGMDLLIGGSAADSLDGGEGNDWLQGGGGGDILVGGAGADRFVIADSSDSSAAAADTIRGFESGLDKIDLSAVSPTSVSLSASSGITTLTAQTAGGTVVIRIEGAVTPGDIVQGPAGTVLNGTAGAEVLSATGAVHELHGGAGEDLLVGSIGSDLLDGGAGGDVMIGGLGNDIYIVDEKWIDHVVELDGEGVDEVRSYVQYELPDGVENLTFLGAGGIRVEGNRLDNVMTGNAESNILAGGDGNDVLIGGGAGDFLEGGLGADRFVYLTSADSTAAAYDVLYGFQSGSDKIDLTALSVASISWTKQTENTGVSLWNYFMVTVATADAPLTIRVTADVLSMSDFLVHSVIVGTPGNDTLQGTFFADSIDGMGGNDTIYGAQGDDTIDGMGGDDTIYGAEGDDTIAGGGGQNALYGESGNDRLTASGSAGDRLFGGLGNDVLEGGAGNDRLQGDAGSDRLTGGSGADIFAFLNTADSAGYSMRSDGKKLLPDVITDFVSGVDKISLEAIDAVDGGDPSDAFSWLGTGAFTHHAGEVRYDIADGRANVYADTNGDGLADMQIVVMTTSLAATDFIF